MIRLFTGISIPEDLSADLASLRGGLPSARWVEPADYHLTLQFIGNVEEHIAEELDAELDRLRKAPVDVIADSLLVFGGNKPRSVVIGLRPTPSLVDLQASHSRILKRLDIPFDGRKYVPHITIARLKATSSAAVAEYIDSRGYFRARSFIADKFILYSSAKSTGGGPYQAEAEYELRN